MGAIGYMRAGLQRYFTNIKSGVVWRHHSPLFIFIILQNDRFPLSTINYFFKVSPPTNMNAVKETQAIPSCKYDTKLWKSYIGICTLLLSSLVFADLIHNPTVPYTHTGNDKILNIIFKSNKFLACSKIPSVTNLIVN